MSAIQVSIVPRKEKANTEDSPFRTALVGSMLGLFREHEDNPNFLGVMQSIVDSIMENNVKKVPWNNFENLLGKPMDAKKIEKITSAFANSNKPVSVSHIALKLKAELSPSKSFNTYADKSPNLEESEPITGKAVLSTVGGELVKKLAEVIRPNQDKCLKFALLGVQESSCNFKGLGVFLGLPFDTEELEKVQKLNEELDESERCDVALALIVELDDDKSSSSSEDEEEGVN